ncbi:acetyl-CoA carboxylase biotin carboxyl carrier protein [Pseudomonas arsenicoxydans]|uniref:Biotin carboxyl carrier protein of acetyl-CoA carboxylase n=1 Tax=Pseudomonas arsenicoxydans TaxID=702115 RepID=A0A4P6G6T1_9PSED|nr:acetyl-CoA carboxylase biotin carboxyl carrier protein subunit [Pseudomonas arsenicoxydans]QAY85232.1 acetyl-CoA carboxylase biotin carboxyl carrier protein subunit [Pseudomonas arsenicoxydans]
MDSERIKGLIDLLAESDLLELSLTEGDSTIRLFRQAGKVVVTEAQADPSPLPTEQSPTVAIPSVTATEIKASLYGVLHLTPAVGEAPFVVVGDQVEAGQTLAVLEAMKMFHPVKAKTAGQVTAILAHSGAEVEAGQSLFRLG